MALTKVSRGLLSTSIVDNGNATAITIDSSENVGIGSSSPSSYHAPADNLVIGSSGDNGLTIASGTSSGGTICFADGTSGGAQYAGFIDYQHNGDYMRFGTNLGVERLRIDSSGNLLVGKTSVATNVEGGELRENGQVIAVATNVNPFFGARLGSDGDLAVFRKDTTTVGSIGSVTQSGATNLVLDSTSAVYFDTNARPKTDNTYDVGSGTYRFKDLYLSGGAYLGGTGSANKLDDYEEGTWTPTLSGSTTNPTPTAVTVTNANYTKIGNTVFIRAYINVNLSNVGSGAAQIEGLPFAVKVGAYAPALFTHGSLIHSSGGYFASGATRIVAIDDNSVAGTPFAGTGTVRYLMITGQYETA